VRVLPQNMENDEIERAAGVALGSLLPAKSGDRYNLSFQQFMKWCEINGVQDISENVLLAYFQQRSTVLKSPSSLWSEYSMLKMTLSLNRNQDISKFTKLKMFLKRKNQGFVPKKSKIFSKEEIEKFLVEAPNQIYLMMKVVTIMGVAGACRGDELHKMKLKDVECDKENVAVVNIKESKNNMLRRFVVSNSADSQVDYLKLLRDYIKLRPRNAQDERLFYRYERGRCVNQVVGKHTIATHGTHDE
jgi:integrase